MNTSVLIVTLAFITLLGWLEYLRTCRIVYRTAGSPEALEALGKAAAGFWKYRWRWHPRARNQDDK